MKRISLVALIIGSVILVVIATPLVVSLVSKARTQEPGEAAEPRQTAAATSGPASSPPAEGNAQSGVENKADGTPGNGLPTMIDFGSDGCVPCEQMKPILKALEAEYSGQVNVILYNVYKEGELARKYAIRLIPTQIFLTADGKEVHRHMGFMDKKDIVAKFKELGFLPKAGSAK